MGFLITIVIVGHLTLILLAVSPSLQSMGSKHLQYNPHPGHARAAEREARWYPVETTARVIAFGPPSGARDKFLHGMRRN